MRITSIELSGFRAFSTDRRFDLNGDIVLVVGVNGQGKTSLFDAILWAISGEISRLANPESIVSLYSDSGEAQVKVEIVSDNGERMSVTRYHDGQNQRLTVEGEGGSHRGAEAEHELIRWLWPEGLTANEPQAALRLAIERGVYLQQDVLTSFLTADTDQERFNVISEIVGAGLVTELQVALENSRRAWSRASNQQKSQLEDAEERMRRLEAQLVLLTGTIPTGTIHSEGWAEWWSQANRIGVSDFAIPAVDSADAHATIDIAMSELQAIRLSRQRRGDRLRELADALQELPTVEFDLDDLQQKAEESAQSLTTARETLAEAEERVSEIRRRQIETRSEQEELKVIADIALRHLRELCPVCQQAYNREATRERLTALVGSTVDSSDFLQPIPDLVPLTGDVQLKETEASSAASILQNTQRLVRIKLESQERIREGLAELMIDLPNKLDGKAVSDVLEAAIEENNQELENITEVSKQGETIALALARAGQLARKAELEKEVLEATDVLAAARNEIQAREKTGELVSSMIENIREASSALVESELKRLEGLLQRIYLTADPHPEFRVVRLLSRMRQGRGRLFAEVADPINQVSNEDPRAFLSSSQLNVLAVSVFLALNLGIPELPLQLAILDDPLQSLDDLNLLGLVDLVKRTREHRQLMISTHDIRFASLLERKLRPVTDYHRTIRVDLGGWTSKGPMASQHDIMRDPEPMRLAAD